MTAMNKLRNSLIRKIQQLSLDKLIEINDIVNNKKDLNSKEGTLKLAGSWKDLDNTFFVDLTEKLHQNRIGDRKTD